MSTSGISFVKIGKKGRWQSLAVESVSDGVQHQWPAKPYRPSSEENYLIVLGEKWASRLGIKEPGIQYYLSSLPAGYATFEVDQPGGPQVYKRLFGHPAINGAGQPRFFDSIATFEEHFFWLMDGMENECNCRLCGKKQPVKKIAPVVHGQLTERRPRETVNISKPVQARSRLVASEGRTGSTRESSATSLATGRAKRDVKQPGAMLATDEEGTEDVYKKFVKRLETHKDSNNGIDDDITEEDSIDWRAEHEWDGTGFDQLPTVLTQAEQQHSFIPRIGELVLFTLTFLDGHHLMINPATSQYMYYSFEQVRWAGFPSWRAGVVTAVPTKIMENGPVDFPDILDTPNKKTTLNTSGFRVETLPDPNDPFDKSASKQYKWVPLRNIRPLSHWQALLYKVPEQYMHPSIRHAFSCMTSISLLEKYKAVGQWNACTIFCKGVYLGAELIIIGDVVRLVPQKPSDQCTDVMIIDSIRLNLEDMTLEHTLPTSPYLCSKSSITFVGSAYSLAVPSEDIDDDIQITPNAVPPDQVKTMFRPVGSNEYGSWYELHDQRKRFVVSHEQVLGRMHEADAVRLWTGQLQHKTKRRARPTHKPSLTFDTAGIISARRFATKTDARIPEPTTTEDILWFWADTRAEALAVETFNGIEVGKYDDVRTKATTEYWANQMMVLNGKQVTTAASPFVKFLDIPGFGGSGGDGRGRKPGAKLVNGKVIYPGQQSYPGGRMGVVLDSSEDGEDEEQQLKPLASAMVNAAYVSPSENDGAGDEDEDDDDDDDDDMDIIDVTGGYKVLQQFAQKQLSKVQPTPTPAPVKKPLTKVNIMESVEGGQEFEDEQSDDDMAWFKEPPVVRGGTEESDGGDYRPT